MPIFPYGDQEIAHLSKRDPLLGAYIAEVGPIARAVEPDTFAALVYHIVGQQISTKAQENVWGRVQACCGVVTPQSVAAQSAAALQACGLSWRKVDYIQDAAARTLAGEFDWQDLQRYSDEELIRHLTQLRGVGRWTVEMLLLFSLLRPDVLAYDDLAIQRGLCRLYGLERVDKQQFAVYRERYAPYGSTALLYLWHKAKE